MYKYVRPTCVLIKNQKFKLNEHCKKSSNEHLQLQQIKEVFEPLKLLLVASLQLLHFIEQFCWNLRSKRVCRFNALPSHQRCACANSSSVNADFSVYADGSVGVNADAALNTDIAVAEPLTPMRARA